MKKSVFVITLLVTILGATSIYMLKPTVVEDSYPSVLRATGDSYQFNSRFAKSVVLDEDLSSITKSSKEVKVTYKTKTNKFGLVKHYVSINDGKDIRYEGSHN